MRTAVLLLSLIPALVAGSFAQSTDGQKETTQTSSKQKGGVTEITAEKEAQFDSGAHIGIFIGSVVVKDPQFTLSSDKLTVYLNKKEGGLEKAVAEGNVVIRTQRPSKDSEGKDILSTGKAQKANYDPKTGDIELIGAPEVQQGINLHKAADPETRMVLNKDGRMKTYGRSKTVIQDQEKEGPRGGNRSTN